MQLNKAQRKFLSDLKAENDKILSYEPRVGDLGLKLQNRTISLIQALDKLGDLE